MGYRVDITESNTHSISEEVPDSSGTGTEPGAVGLGGETLGGEAGNTTEKNPEDWVTGDEPMTGAQRSYLDTLARQAGEEISADLTKAEASEHIDRLQQQTGRS